MIRVNQRDRVDGKQTVLKKQRVSPRGMYVWGVNQQWPNNHITLFERTRQNVLLDVVTTPADKKQVNSCVLQHLFC